MCRRVQGHILRARQGEELRTSVWVIQKEFEEALWGRRNSRFGRTDTGDAWRWCGFSTQVRNLLPESELSKSLDIPVGTGYDLGSDNVLKRKDQPAFQLMKHWTILHCQE